VNHDIQKPVIVAIGVYISGYSFTRVFESLFRHLSEFYSIHWVGLGYQGEIKQTENYLVYPVNLLGGDIFGAYCAKELAPQINAKAILVLNDFFILKNYKIAFDDLKANSIRLIAYVPFDGEIADVEMMRDCLIFDEMVLFHEKNLEDVKSALNKYLQHLPNLNQPIPNLSFAYHGVDISIFQKAISRSHIGVLKEKIFKGIEASEVIFILNANRFDPRKNIERTIEAFAKALPFFKKNVFLCLHTPNLKPENKSLLEALISKSGCQENIILNPLGENYVDDTRLTELYQVCEIGVNSSLGEGWGMISFEHAACGATQIVSTHSAPGHLWKEVGVLIPNSTPVSLPSNPFLMHNVDVEELAKQFILLINHEEYLFATGEACYKFSQSSDFDWKTIANHWREILM
jgi:D-inositol-3-phosphate glycosyltransferase